MLKSWLTPARVSGSVIPPPIVSQAVAPITRTEATISPLNSAPCSPCSSFVFTAKVPAIEARMIRFDAYEVNAENLDSLGEIVSIVSTKIVEK